MIFVIIFTNLGLLEIRTYVCFQFSALFTLSVGKLHTERIKKFKFYTIETQSYKSPSPRFVKTEKKLTLLTV